jgi:hypothetical protein
MIGSHQVGGTSYGSPLLQFNKAFVADRERRVPIGGPYNFLAAKSEKLLARFIYIYNRWTLCSQAVATSWTA